MFLFEKRLFIFGLEKPVISTLKTPVLVGRTWRCGPVVRSTRPSEFGPGGGGGIGSTGVRERGSTVGKEVWSTGGSTGIQKKVLEGVQEGVQEGVHKGVQEGTQEGRGR